MPFPRNVLFDGFFFSMSGSWVPVVDTEPLLFGQAIGHIGIKAVFLIGWRVFPVWCLTKGGRDPPSPKLYNRLGWTRRLPRSQTESHHRDAAKGVVWEKCQTVQDELNREHGLLKTLVCPRIQQSVVYFLACLQASQASLASVCGCQDDWSIERQPEGAGCSREAFHPSSLGTCRLSDAAVLEAEYDPWLFSLTSQESQVWSLLGQEYSWE